MEPAFHKIFVPKIIVPFVSFLPSWTYFHSTRLKIRSENTIEVKTDYGNSGFRRLGLSESSHKNSFV